MPRRDVSAMWCVLGDGDRFCEDCGAPLGRCPSCGERVTPGKPFCRSCGQQLSDRAPPQPVRASAPPEAAQGANGEPTPAGVRRQASGVRRQAQYILIQDERCHYLVASRGTHG